MLCVKTAKTYYIKNASSGIRTNTLKSNYITHHTTENKNQGMCVAVSVLYPVLYLNDKTIITQVAIFKKMHTINRRIFDAAHKICKNNKKKRTK